MGPYIRSFIAIELPEGIQRGLVRLQQKLEMPGLKVRWTNVEAMHLTVKFLGDIRRETVPEVGTLMRKSAEGIPPLNLAVEGLGSFPRNGPPRIVWVGVTGDVEALGTLAERLEEAAREIGAKGEERKYVPHLTLGRVKAAPPEFSQHLATLGKPVLGGFHAEGMTLFMTELTRDGGTHTPLDRVEFR